MKIVNICLCGPYNVGWGYQENLLSKYQKINGNDVCVIASSLVNDKKSAGLIYSDREVEYDNQVKIIRLKPRISKSISKVFKIYKGLYKYLELENPDLIFIHGCQFLDIYEIIKYCKNNPNVKVKIDNHADFSNTAVNFFGKLINKTLWKKCAKKILPYTEIFYGVLPARCDFLNIMYDIPRDKIELLVMGGDDEKILRSSKNICETRRKIGFKSEDFIICTGGKIDKYKIEILDLILAVNDIKIDNLKLIIFGSVDKTIEDKFNECLDKTSDDRIKYLGWLNQDDIYDILCSSNVAFFPGRHSVLWEQAICCGLVSVYKYYENYNHLCLNNNSIFIRNPNYENISDIILKLATDKKYYLELKHNTDRIKNIFLYSNIASKSVE